MPNQPKTPNRTFRISDELYHRIETIAKQRGVTVTEVVRLALEKYADDLTKTN